MPVAVTVAPPVVAVVATPVAVPPAIVTVVPPVATVIAAIAAEVLTIVTPIAAEVPTVVAAIPAIIAAVVIFAVAPVAPVIATFAAEVLPVVAALAAIIPPVVAAFLSPGRAIGARLRRRDPVRAIGTALGALHAAFGATLLPLGCPIAAPLALGDLGRRRLGTPFGTRLRTRRPRLASRLRSRGPFATRFARRDFASASSASVLRQRRCRGGRGHQQRYQEFTHQLVSGSANESRRG